MTTLTSDEILNKEAGPELNDLVAVRVMRWKISPDKMHYIKRVAGITVTVPCGDFCPSENIADAWQVMALFDLLGRDVDLRNVVAGWICQIDQTNIGRDVFVPLAICRAALLAVMDGDK